ncbi:mandelate racemase/muconate lactonizing enzyme family protein [Paraburkholderia bannensis]|uniref:mandelate racemase/muconate lactonizing enzyme family protein n=2 Tax=Paraburkholderia bannensis TaxID=765414 RepID=UPI002AB5FCFE|nr:enolase C-terminal domain-like protein [Paraburkholderia bannensis]
MTHRGARHVNSNLAPLIAMKITRIECIPLSMPLKKPLRLPNVTITCLNTVLLRVYADTGLVGVAESGDTSSWYRGESQASIVSMICDVFAPRILLGEDPRNIEKIVGAMDTLARDNNQAKALVDCALHDLKGKALGVPVYDLLGGRTREAVPLGWVLSAGEPEQVASTAVAAREAGYAAFKLKVGRGTFENDIATAAAVRTALGDGARIMLDANGSWNYEEALRTIRRLDRYRLDFVEQPLPHWDRDGMARLRERVETPIYADEGAQELHHLREIAERRSADGVILKVQKVGGLLKAQRFLAVCRLYDLPVFCSTLIGSGIEACPSTHLWVADQWACQFMSESAGPLAVHAAWNSDDIPAGEDLALGGQRFHRGHAYPNERPGYGVDVDETLLARIGTPGKPAVSVGE